MFNIFAGIVIPIFFTLAVVFYGMWKGASDYSKALHEGKFWVYEMSTRCMYCEKPFNAVFSIVKPIKEEKDG